jgi:cytochrome c oxidase subunit II
MKWHSATVWLLWVLAAGMAGAGSRSRPGAPARTGREIYETCRLCHSTKEMQRGPILDGLPAWYVMRQLEKFREGVRGANPANRSEALMGATQSVLQNDEEIRRVAEFISSLPPPAHLATVRGDVRRGKGIYLVCLPCHGDRAQGNPAVKAPPLYPQEDWYLMDQLRKFKAAQRGVDPRDAEGRIMQQMVSALAPQDLHDVVRYLKVTLAPTNRPSAIKPFPATN